MRPKYRVKIHQASAGLPRTRAVAPACCSRSNPPSAAGDRLFECLSGPAPLRSPRDDGGAFPPRSRRPWPDRAGCCGVGPLRGRHSARIPGVAPAEPRRLSGDVPGSGGFVCKALEYCLFQLGLCQNHFELDVLLLRLSQPSGLLGLYTPYCCLQR
jgi:hypothetical protein